ncbi:glucose 1-dehydrogenase [Muribaculum intestinale]|uniref:glucose 1-dehydrogenase n=1 Tax=Muribaculum intestinale TaxID=1796646 RepID=UPI00260C8183|nr:glucose 1-dehydrogenase [Muribaculum intestinale]
MNTVSLFDLTGKVAVVTGGGDGIGKGCCEILAGAGASVVVSDLSVEKAQTTADEIVRAGGEAVATACNVLNENDLTALIEFTVKTYCTVNILVNNAGLGGGGRENPFKIDRAYVERIYAINVFAPWQLCKLAVPYMQESGYGSIINITSMSSVNNEPDMAIYGSSKAALNHMASNLAFDYGPMGVRINNVAPGATNTQALASVLTPELKEKMLERTPIKRLGDVSDIAGAVLYFAAPVSAWVSGQVLMVNGGGVQTLD